MRSSSSVGAVINSDISCPGGADCAGPVAGCARLDPASTAAVQARGLALVQAVRAARPSGSGLDAFLREYHLASREGVILMCLAEALLRIPDAATADRLIADKISSGDWQEHLGDSDSLFVNASTWGLMLTGSIVDVDRDEVTSVGGWSRTSCEQIRRGHSHAPRCARRCASSGNEVIVMGRSIEEKRSSAPMGRPRSAPTAIPVRHAGRGSADRG